MTIIQSFYIPRLTILGILLTSLLTINCGAGSDGLPINWTIDAKDWTNPDAANDLRDCLNKPSLNHTNIDYPVLKTVHIEVRDPLNQVQPAIKDVPCEAGSGDRTIQFPTLSPNEYNVTISALDQNGNIVYQFTEEKVDISKKEAYPVELRAVTGETRFSLKLDEARACPTNATQIKWNAFKNGEEKAFATNTITNICVDSTDSKIFDTLYAHGVPVEPTYLEGTDKYDVDTYKFQIELLDANGTVLGCSAKTSRTIRPGFISANATLQSSTDDISLTSGACSQ